MQVTKPCPAGQWTILTSSVDAARIQNTGRGTLHLLVTDTADIPQYDPRKEQRGEVRLSAGKMIEKATAFADLFDVSTGFLWAFSSIFTGAAGVAYDGAAPPVPQPISTGPITPGSFRVGEYSQFKVSDAFAGTDLAFSLAPGSVMPAGLDFLTVGPDTYIGGVPETESTTALVVRASNDGGYADSPSFNLAIAGVPVVPVLALALSGDLTPDSTVTLTATITGATVTDLTSASLSVGGVAVALSGGPGLVREGTIPAGATAGAVIAAMASATAGGQTISGSATGEVAEGVPDAPAILPVTATARYSAQHSNVTLDGNSRIVSATDLMALAGLSEGAAGIGPLQVIDGLGRKAWRFSGAQYLKIAAELVTANRNLSVFMVMRQHKCAADVFFSTGRADLGNTAGANKILDAGVLSSSAPSLRCFGRNATLDAANVAKMILGSQVQIIGTVGRATAGGGIISYMNRAKAYVGQSATATTGVTGGEIGRDANSITAFGQFDMYELVVIDRAVTEAEADGIADALCTYYGVEDVAHQLVLEADSITAGSGVNMPSHGALSMMVTEPGAGLIPANWRVICMAIAGNTVANAVTRRDAANGWSSHLLPGRNVLSLQVGRNDLTPSNRDAAVTYAAIVAYLNTTTTGVLQRGWDVRVRTNVAESSAAVQAEIVRLRGFLQAPQFLTDTGSASGGAFDGKVMITQTHAITDGGNAIFDTSADAVDTNYYFADGTHPNLLGQRLQATGGDDPSKGTAYGLAA